MSGSIFETQCISDHPTLIPLEIYGCFIIVVIIIIVIIQELVNVWPLSRVVPMPTGHVHAAFPSPNQGSVGVE